MRCMLIAWVDAQDKDPAVAQSGKLAGMYWLGRVNGTIADKDLVARFSGEAHAMDNVDVQAEAERCNAELTAQTVQLQQVAKAVQDETTKQATPSK